METVSIHWLSHTQFYHCVSSSYDPKVLGTSLIGKMKTLTGFKFIQFFIQDLSVEVCREWRKVGKVENLASRKWTKNCLYLLFKKMIKFIRETDIYYIEFLSHWRNCSTVIVVRMGLLRSHLKTKTALEAFSTNLISF